jgi:hypothetical protein
MRRASGPPQVDSVRGEFAVPEKLAGERAGALGAGMLVVGDRESIVFEDPFFLRQAGVRRFRHPGEPGSQTRLGGGEVVIAPYKHIPARLHVV